MAIKTILVHLADDSMNELRQTVGIQLASRLDSHLVAMYIMGDSSGKPSVGRSASFLYSQALSDARHKEAEALAEAFDKRVRGLDIPHRFVFEEGNTNDILEHHARAADLLIVSQSKIEHLEDYFRHLLAEELVLTSGIPVLILPLKWKHHPIGDHIMIAWKPTREAVRAVRDNLDFLKAARQVDLLVIDERDGDLPPRQILLFLERHGIKANLVKQARAPGKTSARQILRARRKAGADLLISGGHGRSRVHEIFIGHTTRKLLRHLDCPLIMSY